MWSHRPAACLGAASTSSRATTRNRSVTKVMHTALSTSISQRTGNQEIFDSSGQTSFGHEVHRGQIV